MSFWDDGPENDDDKGTVNKQNPFANQKQPKYKYDDSESSDGGKRVVKTPKEKLMELMKNSSNKIRDNISSKNFIVASEVFDELVKSFDKIKQLFGDNLPLFFIKTLYLLEETTNINKEERVKLSTKNNTSLTGIKKTFTKYIKNFEENLKNYKDKKAAGGEGEEEDESEELSDEDNQVLSDVSVDVDLKKNDDLDPAIRRLKWVKKTPATSATKNADEPAKQKIEKIRPAAQNRERDRDETIVVERLDDKAIEKECNDITNQRGQISKNPTQTVERLDYLLTQTNNKLLIIKLLNLYILICFDTSIGQFSAISYEMWHKIHDSLLVLIDHYNDLMKQNNENLKDSLDVIKINMKTTLVSVLEKLEIELYKALQYTDQNSHEYILRIKDEITFIVLCSKVLEFYRLFKEDNCLSRIYLLILLHIYYKTEDQIKKMGEKLKNENIKDTYLSYLSENPENFITELSGLLYSHTEDKSKVKSLLAIIYSYCILNKYFKANILFKKCNSYDMIGVLKDENLKILYNRTLAQLGLCAFRNGIYSDALLYLTPLCQLGTSKLKEYLSQSYNKDMEKSIFFDKEDKKRIIPFIMTINIDEIECTFYISSMLIDLPNILLYKLGKNCGSINLVFKKLMDNFEKQVFNGPPETIKELILCSASSLTKGDWKKCSELILSLKCYNHYKTQKEIKNILSINIKNTALKCYLIFYSGDIRNISVKNLSRKFEIAEKETRHLINLMILDKNLDARWRDDVLEIDTEDKNVKLIKRLEENLNHISQHNLNLLEISSGCQKKL